MTSMVYVDPDYGPSAAEILDAVRQSEGSPGRLVSWLTRAEPRESDGGMTIHESRVAYEPPETADGMPRDGARTPEQAPATLVRRSRIGSVLWRAGRRAAGLQACGRHTAAVRLLTRAACALEGRGEVSQAARYWLQLGAVVRARGALSKAYEYAARAARTDDSAECQVLAGLLEAVCWTDDLRLGDAEGALRTLVASSATLGNEALEHQCRVALARSLCWHGRAREAGEILAPLESSSPEPSIRCGALVLRCRILREDRDLAASLRAAREALALAEQVADPCLLARTHRELADTLRPLGEIEQVRAHVRQGIEAARQGRLPLALLRLRVVLLHALVDTPTAPLEEERLRAVLARARRRTLPGVVAHAIDAALLRPRGPAPAPASTGAGPALVEEFLDLAQRARDDGEAVGQVAAAACTRLGAAACVVATVDGRIVSAAGKPWREGSLALAQVLAGGQRVLFDPRHQPPEAAEPIRCGGDLVGALACRWIAGSTAIPALVSDVSARRGHGRRHAPACAGRDLPGAASRRLGGSARRERGGRGAARCHSPRRAGAVSGARGRRERQWQGAGRAGDPQALAAPHAALLRDQLRGARRRPDRSRALRPHARRVHRRRVASAPGCSRKPTAARSSSTKWGSCRRGRRPSCCASCRRARSAASAKTCLAASTSASSRPPIAGSSARRPKAVSAWICGSGSTSCASTCRRCASGRGTCRCSRQHFWRAAADRVGSRAVLGPDALAALARYDWPGNVRELQNAIAWMAVHAPRRGRIGSSSLPSHLASVPLATGSSFEAAREDFERRFVRAALAQAGGQRHVLRQRRWVSRARACRKCCAGCGSSRGRDMVRGVWPPELLFAARRPICG